MGLDYRSRELLVGNPFVKSFPSLTQGLVWFFIFQCQHFGGRKAICLCMHYLLNKLLSEKCWQLDLGGWEWIYCRESLCCAAYILKVSQCHWLFSAIVIYFSTQPQTAHTHYPHCHMLFCGPQGSCMHTHTHILGIDKHASMGHTIYTSLQVQSEIQKLPRADQDRVHCIHAHTPSQATWRAHLWRVSYWF